MEDLILVKHQSSSFKTPNRKNTIPLDQTPDGYKTSNENGQKKALVFKEDLLPFKTSSLIKTPGVARDTNIFMSPAIKTLTPKVMKNYASRSPIHDSSSKKTTKTSQFEKSSKGLPHLTSDEKKKIFGESPSPNGFYEGIEQANETGGLEEYRSNEHIANKKDFDRRASNHQKLPSLIEKKAMNQVEKKLAKKVESKNQQIGKGDIENHVHSLIVNRGMSVSPIKDSKANWKTNNETSTEKRQERPMVREGRRENHEGKSYSEDKAKTFSLYKGHSESASKQEEKASSNLLKKNLGKGVAKILTYNLSGGEEEDVNNDNLSFSLQIAPLKGAQRTIKATKKKVENLKERKATTPDGKRKIVETILTKNTKKKRDEEKGLGSKRKLRESKEPKEKLEKSGHTEMQGWEKQDLEPSPRDDHEDDEEEQKEQEKEDKPVEKFERRSIKKSQSQNFDEVSGAGKDRKIRDKIDRSKENLALGATPKKHLTGTREVKEGSTLIRSNKKVEHPIKMSDKEKEVMNNRRDQAYKEFMQKLNFSFNVIIRLPAEKTFTSYKYFLGKGNNSIMIRAMMKQRWWWTQIENKEAADLNFMWTQLKQNKFIENLKMTRKTPFEVLEGSGISSHGNGNDTTAHTITTLDSLTECESDTTEGENKDKHKKGKKSLLKSGKKGLKKTIEANENTQNALQLLFTSSEIGLMNSSEDYEEIGKIRKGPLTQIIQDPSAMKMCNHLESNFHLANKKALLWNMKSYYEATKENVFDYLPLTFHVRKGFEDKEYQKFLEYYNNREQEIQEQEKLLQENKEAKKTLKKLRNLWIVKPGENTNRGIGITVCNELSQINELIATIEGNNEKKRTYLIQQYLDRPFLYNKRKFDIRCYILITCINGTMKGYWYQDGYIRTATKEFSLKNVTNKLIHLTNDAVQKKAEDYGKFEAGNKLSYNDFQKYLDANYNGTINFNNDMYPQIRKLAIDCIKGVYGKMDPNRRENCFEVFGLDFMFDQDLKAWLIEVNTNPDINASSPALMKVIPPMVENALRLTIDQMYPIPSWHQSKKLPLPENLLENNKFELVFDEVEDGPALRSILQPEKGATGDLILEIVAEEEEETEEAND